MSLRSVCLALLALAACRAHEGSTPRSSDGSLTETNATHAIVVVPTPGTGPDARTPFAPVEPTIDPKSTEAAEELAQSFVQLLNKGKFDQAYQLLGPGAVPRRDFDRQLMAIKNLQAVVGTPGRQEGAAGSIYIGIPLTIAGEMNGEQVSWQAGLILRRVNDVPGSTEAQRRWHIERLNLSGND